MMNLEKNEYGKNKSRKKAICVKHNKTDEWSLQIGVTDKEQAVCLWGHQMTYTEPSDHTVLMNNGFMTIKIFVF